MQILKKQITEIIMAGLAPPPLVPYHDLHERDRSWVSQLSVRSGRGLVAHRNFPRASPSPWPSSSCCSTGSSPPKGPRDLGQPSSSWLPVRESARITNYYQIPKITVKILLLAACANFEKQITEIIMAGLAPPPLVP